nr:virulence protein [Caproiciproducens faecalis]
MGAIDEFPDIDQHNPGRYVNPNSTITETMQRQIDEVIAFEDLRMDGREELGLGRTRHENFQGENGMQASDVPEPYDNIGLVIEIPRSSFTDTALENLKRLVESKDSLIKKALGTKMLELVITDDKVRFPWFEDGTDPDAVKAYSHFVTALCEMARVQKRVTAKEKETDNDKYAFRCFLLRLGFIGDEYKDERKILLRNLTGSAAFKSGQKKIFSQEDLDKAKSDPAVRAEIKTIFGGNDDEQ